MEVPENLNWLRQTSSGRDWLAHLPTMMTELCAIWGLEVEGAPYSGGSVSLVVPVLRSGEPCVLKIQWPHNESAYEADALMAWNGIGAVKLLDHDRKRHALLLEKCVPGRFLYESTSTDQIGVVIDLLPRLWIKADGPFETIHTEVRQWMHSIPDAWLAAGKPCEWRLVNAAMIYAESLSENQGKPVLIHQDLHGGNIISAEREPWLVIDPKPLIGECELSLAPIVRSAEFGHSEDAAITRLNRITEALELDRERAIGWTVLQTMAWSFDGQFDERNAELVRWLLAAR